MVTTFILLSVLAPAVAWSQFAIGSSFSRQVSKNRKGLAHPPPSWQGGRSTPLGLSEDDEGDDERETKLQNGTQKQNSNKINEAGFIAQKIEQLQPLEVRMDVTILFCFVLARGLFTEILTRPLKTCAPDVGCPGLYPEDIKILLDIFSSGCTLSLLWCFFGTLATQQFTVRSRDETLFQFILPTLTTWVLAGPCWILLKEDGGFLGSWLVEALSYSSNELAVSPKVLDLAVSSLSVTDLAAHDGLPLLGLLVTMIASRLIAFVIP